MTSLLSETEDLDFIPISAAGEHTKEAEQRAQLKKRRLAFERRVAVGRDNAQRLLTRPPMAPASSFGEATSAGKGAAKALDAPATVDSGGPRGWLPAAFSMPVPRPKLPEQQSPPAESATGQSPPAASSFGLFRREKSEGQPPPGKRGSSDRGAARSPFAQQHKAKKGSAVPETVSDKPDMEAAAAAPEASASVTGVLGPARASVEAWAMAETMDSFQPAGETSPSA